jgi:hypothetical protein
MYSNQSRIRKKAMKGGFFPMMGAMGNPMELLQKFNPLSMLMGKGAVMPQYEYKGKGAVMPQYEYKGKGAVMPQYEYKGKGYTGGMSAGEFFNPMTSPLSPLSWASKIFGGGQSGGMMPKHKKKSTVRGQKVAQLMREKGMTLGQASKYLKSIGQ